MVRLAVIWVDGGEVRLAATPMTAVTSVLAVANAVFRDGFACFEADRLDAVCEELDRLGFLWAVDQRFVPRTWADHLFDGIHPDLHVRVRDVLSSVLMAAEDGLAAWAILELAWFSRLSEGDLSSS